MTTRLSALGLPAPYPSDDVSLTLSGAAVNAEAGNVAGTGLKIGATGRLSPLGLAMSGYKQLTKVGSTTVTLLGAEVRCQGEELEGTHITVRIDGATMFGDAGQLIPTRTGPDHVVIGLPLTRVKELSAFSATVNFRYRATSSPMAPETVRYRIDCLTTRQEVLDWTTIATGTTISIPILPEHNKLLSGVGTQRRTERKQLIVQSDTATTTTAFGSVIWTVDNIFGVN
jgi:hypothetical protein